MKENTPKDAKRSWEKQNERNKDKMEDLVRVYNGYCPVCSNKLQHGECGACGWNVRKGDLKW